MPHALAQAWPGSSFHISMHAVRFELVPNGFDVQPQSACRFCLVVARCLQSLEYQPFFDFHRRSSGERSIGTSAGSALILDIHGQMRGLNPFSLGKYYGSFHDVSQFANVARPGIRAQQFERLSPCMIRRESCASCYTPE